MLSGTASFGWLHAVNLSTADCGALRLKISSIAGSARSMGLTTSLRADRLQSNRITGKGSRCARYAASFVWHQDEAHRGGSRLIW